MFRSSIRKLGSTLGLLAILLSTLAPPVSQALAAHERLSIGLATECSARGTAPRSTGLHLDACAYCALAAAHSAAPPPHAYIHPVYSIHPPTPAMPRALGLATAAASYPSAQPRAPPARPPLIAT